MEQSIELYNKITDPAQWAISLGTAFWKAKWFGCETIEDGQLLALSCACERMSPVRFKQTYHLIKGQLSMRADAMLAKFRTERGGDHEVIERTAERAAVKLIPKGKPGVVFELTWTQAQGEKYVYGDGGKFKDNWNTLEMRKKMLWARVISDGVRTLAPEVVAGIYTPEEIGDFSDASPKPSILTPKTEVVVEPPKQEKPEPKPEPKVIDVTPVTPTPTPEPPKVDDVPGLNDKGQLNVATITALMQAIPGEHQATALDAWKKKGHIKDAIGELPLKFASAILKNPSGFLKSIGIN
jgi:hypothetical protein